MKNKNKSTKKGKISQLKMRPNIKPAFLRKLVRQLYFGEAITKVKDKRLHFSFESSWFRSNMQLRWNNLRDSINGSLDTYTGWTINNKTFCCLTGSSAD